MMKKLFFLLCITILFFSCTIEKRRYFKGYHVALRQAQGPVQKRESGALRQAQGTGNSESAQAQQGAANTASDNEKPQRGDIIIEGETSHVKEAPKAQRGDIGIADEEVMVDENIITDNNTNTERRLAVEKLIQPELDHNANSSQGGDVVDVGRVIFGMLSIVSFAIALLFFGSAIFAIDSLVMTVLLLIGGGFALAGLVFLVIYALIKRKQSADGLINGSINQGTPDKNEPKSIWGMVIAFLIAASISAYLIVLLNSSAGSLVAWLVYLSFLSIVGSLAIVFAVLAVLRWIRRNHYKESKSFNPPKEYQE